MSGPTPRMTQTTQAVLRALLEDPKKDLYGLEICAATGLPSGTVHPILARFEALGWLDSAWEQVDPREQGRPRRRYYKEPRRRYGPIGRGSAAQESSSVRWRRAVPSAAQ